MPMYILPMAYGRAAGAIVRFGGEPSGRKAPCFLAFPGKRRYRDLRAARVRVDARRRCRSTRENIAVVWTRPISHRATGAPLRHTTSVRRAAALAITRFHCCLAFAWVVLVCLAAALLEQAPCRARQRFPHAL